MTRPPEVGPNSKVAGVVVKITENWVVAVVPMLFNDRVLLSTHEQWETYWEAGFCYDKGGAAALAAAIWDPETEQYPAGYKKIAGDRR